MTLRGKRVKVSEHVIGYSVAINVSYLGKATKRMILRRFDRP